MTTKTKIAGALAALTVAASLTIPSAPAQAHGPGWGVGAGFVGGAIVGAAIANGAAYNGVYYADGYRRCRWERQYDGYGFYVGTVKVCRYL